MKLTLVIFAVLFVALAYAQGQGGKPDGAGGKPGDAGGKPGDAGGKPDGEMKKPMMRHGKGKKGNGFRGPKGSEGEGEEASVDGTRVKTFKKGMKVLLWTELNEDMCKKPEEPVENDETGPTPPPGAGPEMKPKGCPSQPLMINLIRAVQVDSEGNPLKNTSMKFNDVAVECDATDLTEVDVPNSNDGLKALKISCKATLENEAEVTIEVYLATNNGSVENGDETFQISKGQLKVNTIVENWELVEGAAAIDVKMSVGSGKGKGKKKGGKPPGAGKPKEAPKLEFDNGAEVEFSNYVSTGDETEEMPEDFPKVEDGEGSMSDVTVRFPKGCGTKCVYDPISSASNIDDAAQTDDASTIFASKLAIVSVLIASILSKF